MGLKRILFKIIRESNFLITILNNTPFLNSYKVKRGNNIDIEGIMVHSRINIRGKNNKLIVKRGAALLNCSFNIEGNNNEIVIGENCRLWGVNAHFEDDGGKIDIGKDTEIDGRTHLACIEGKKISIGEACLFSSDITLRVGDSHSVTDLSGRRINPSKDIIIGNHVWIGNSVIVLKGTMIGDNCIVGSGAVVSGDFEANQAIGGNPAATIKRDVNWKKERLQMNSYENTDN